jgi:recombination protein RecA
MSGSGFSYGPERIGQGRDSALEYIRQHPAMATDLETKIREALRGDDFVGLPATTESEDATEE